MTHDAALDGAGYGSMSVAAILAETAHRTPDRAAFFLGDQVDRHDDRAEGQHAVVDAGEVGHVRHDHRDAVARADPAGAQGTRVRTGLVPELAVPDHLVAQEERRAVGGAVGGLGEDRRDRHAPVARTVEGLV